MIKNSKFEFRGKHTIIVGSQLYAVEASGSKLRMSRYSNLDDKSKLKIEKLAMVESEVDSNFAVACVLNQSIYVTGGGQVSFHDDEEPGYSDETYMYDLKGNKWSKQ